jgi:hypothetical protein
VNGTDRAEGVENFRQILRKYFETASRAINRKERPGSETQFEILTMQSEKQEQSDSVVERSTGSTS